MTKILKQVFDFTESEPENGIDILSNHELQLFFEKSNFKLFTEKLSELGGILSETQRSDYNERHILSSDRYIRDQAVQQKKISDNIDFDQLYSILLLANISSLLNVINLEFKNFYSNMSYSTPVRANAERSYRNQSLSVNQVNPDGKNVPTILLNLQENKPKKFEEWQIWTKENLNLVFKVINKNNFSSISVKSANSDNFHNLADTGFSYSQMLPNYFEYMVIHGKRSPQQFLY